MSETFKPIIFYKELCTPTIREAVSYMNKWGNENYDIFIVSVSSSPMLDGYLNVRLWGSEYPPSRKQYKC